MERHMFDERFRILESLRGSEAGMELFNDQYENLLRDINGCPRPRYSLLKRLRIIGAQQQIPSEAGDGRRREEDDAASGRIYRTHVKVKQATRITWWISTASPPPMSALAGSWWTPANLLRHMKETTTLICSKL